jgi:hypothetical protein
MRFPRRTFLHLAAGAALPVVSRIARAQNWPSLHDQLDLGLHLLPGPGTEATASGVAVKYAGNQSQCYVHLPFEDLSGCAVRLKDMTGPVVYDRDGNNLVSQGLRSPGRKSIRPGCVSSWALPQAAVPTLSAADRTVAVGAARPSICGREPAGCQ